MPKIDLKKVGCCLRGCSGRGTCEVDGTRLLVCTDCADELDAGVPVDTACSACDAEGAARFNGLSIRLCNDCATQCVPHSLDLVDDGPEEDVAVDDDDADDDDMGDGYEYGDDLHCDDDE